MLSLTLIAGGRFGSEEQARAIARQHQGMLLTNFEVRSRSIGCPIGVWA